jgi:general secretion pathway protein G
LKISLLFFEFFSAICRYSLKAKKIKRSEKMSIARVKLESSPNRGAKGFTLIELLIVVAIIGILASMAMVNFMQAQMRAKVARVRADLRTVATGIEMYTFDHNKPLFDGKHGDPHFGWATAMRQTTTPVDYLSRVFPDVFQDDYMKTATAAPGTTYFIDSPNDSLHCYDYGSAEWHDIGNNLNIDPLWSRNFGNSSWKIGSCGPDLSFLNATSPYWGFGERYDPTNGTVSEGDIYRSQARTQ